MRPGPWLGLGLIALAGCTGLAQGDWRPARRDASGQAPDPAITVEPVIQVYAARTVGWRGALAVHSWIVVKPTGAAAYTRYEVIGWGVDRGIAAIRVNRMGRDDHWLGRRTEILAAVRGVCAYARLWRVHASDA